MYGNTSDGDKTVNVNVNLALTQAHGEDSMSVSSEVSRRGPSMNEYVHLARPDHWFKNIFMLPGAALALLFTSNTAPVSTPLALALTAAAFITLCLAASANYVINEWLDAATDRFHPIKKNRPAVAFNLNPNLVYAEYALLAAASLLLATALSAALAAGIAIFLLMGLIYNVPPLRAKDRAYIDVLTESINNPLRLIIGWVAVAGAVLPPSSLLLAYWMGGAFLMALKRFAEYRMIDDPKAAAAYRRSFAVYTEHGLLVSAFFYALCSAFFLGIFLLKYRIEFLLTFPLFALLFAWYLAISLRPRSVVQSPEKLYREPRFMLYTCFVVVAVVVLFIVDVPALHVLVEPVRF